MPVVNKSSRVCRLSLKLAGAGVPSFLGLQNTWLVVTRSTGRARHLWTLELRVKLMKQQCPEERRSSGQANE